MVIEISIGGHYRTNQRAIDFDEHIFSKRQIEGGHPLYLQLIESCLSQYNILSIAIEIKAGIQFNSLFKGGVAGEGPHHTPSEHVYELAVIAAVPVVQVGIET